MQIVRAVVTALCSIALIVTLVASSVALAVSSTVLDAEFVNAELEAVDVHLLIAEEIKKEVPPEATFLIPIIDEVAVDLQDWAREQVAAIVRGVNAYLKGQQDLVVVISLEEPKSYLKARLGDLLRETPPAGFEGIPPQQIESFVRTIEREIDARIPDLFEMDETYFDKETMAGLTAAQQYTGYLMLSLRVLPVIAVLMVLAIALVQRLRARPVTRWVGASLVAAGTASLGLALAVRSLLPPRVATGVPTEVAVALPDFIVRCSQPLLIYSGVVLLVGACLLLLSSLIRPAES